MRKALHLVAGTLLVLFLPLGASAQGARYDNFAWTTGGSGSRPPIVPVPQASVSVCSLPATGIPCTNTTSIYSNQALSVPVSQPLAADQRGNFGFWIAPGCYAYTVIGQGVVNSGPFPFCVGGELLPFAVVTDHGLKCNATLGVTGSGTDDYAKLQALIDLYPLGAHFLFPAGTCRISGNPKPKGAFIFEGMGCGGLACVSNLQWDNGTDGLTILNANGTGTIKGLGILGAHPFVPAEGSHWIKADIPAASYLYEYKRRITAISRTSNVVTAVLDADDGQAHTFAKGSLIHIENSSLAGLSDGYYYVSGVFVDGANSISFANTAADAVGAAVGTVNISTTGPDHYDGIVASSNFLRLENVLVKNWSRYCIVVHSDSAVNWGDDQNFSDVFTDGCVMPMSVHGPDSNHSNYKHVVNYRSLLGCDHDNGFLGNEWEHPVCTATAPPNTGAAGQTVYGTTVALIGNVGTVATQKPHGLRQGECAIVAASTGTTPIFSFRRIGGRIYVQTSLSPVLTSLGGPSAGSIDAGDTVTIAGSSYPSGDAHTFTPQAIINNVFTYSSTDMPVYPANFNGVHGPVAIWDYGFSYADAGADTGLYSIHYQGLLGYTQNGTDGTTTTPGAVAFSGDATILPPTGSCTFVASVPDTTHFTYNLTHADSSGAGVLAGLADSPTLYTTLGAGRMVDASNPTGPARGAAYSFWIGGINVERQVKFAYCEGDSGPYNFYGLTTLYGATLGCPANWDGTSYMGIFPNRIDTALEPLVLSSDIHLYGVDPTYYARTGGLKHRRADQRLCVLDERDAHDWCLHVNTVADGGVTFVHGLDAFTGKTRLFFGEAPQVLTITSAVRAGGIATLTLSGYYNGPNFATNCAIAGVTNATFDNAFTSCTLGNGDNHIVYTNAGADATSSGGTVTMRVQATGDSALLAEGNGFARISGAGTGGVRLNEFGTGSTFIGSGVEVTNKGKLITTDCFVLARPCVSISGTATSTAIPVFVSTGATTNNTSFQRTSNVVTVIVASTTGLATHDDVLTDGLVFPGCPTIAVEFSGLQKDITVVNGTTYSYASVGGDSVLFDAAACSGGNTLGTTSNVPSTLSTVKNSPLKVVGDMVGSGSAANSDFNGQLTIGGGGTITYTSSSALYNTAPICVVSETTDATKTLKGAVALSGAAPNTFVLTVTGTATDVVNYICSGRN